MKCYRLALIFMIFSGLCWNAYGLISRDGSKSSQSKEFHSADRNILVENEDIDSLNVRTANLERKVTSLLKQLNQIKVDFRKESDILANMLASVDMNVDQQAHFNEEVLSDPMTDQQNAERIEEQWQSAIEIAFTNEVIDEAWSDKSTKAIDSILDNELVTNTDIIDLVCHSTLCKLEVQHQDQGKLDNFESVFPLQIGERFPELTMRHEVGEDEMISSVVYLGREGYHLPDVEMDE